jgi:hypothetical protein
MRNVLTSFVAAVRHIVVTELLPISFNSSFYRFLSWCKKLFECVIFSLDVILLPMSMIYIFEFFSEFFYDIRILATNDGVLTKTVVAAPADDITLAPVMSADGIGIGIALVLVLQVGKPLPSMLRLDHHAYTKKPLIGLFDFERFDPAKKVIYFEGKTRDMKIIALEEHFRNAAIEEAVKKTLPPSQRDFFVASMALSGPPELEDLGIDRLKHMDAMGIDVQVLSYTTPGKQVLPASEAVPLAIDANDEVASAIASHPDRFEVCKDKDEASPNR